MFLKITYSFIFGSAGSSCRAIFPPVGTSGDYSRPRRARASQCSGLSRCTAQALGNGLQQLWLPGLGGSEVCGVLVDQGPKLCLLRWQVHSLPRSHQESPPLLVPDWSVYLFNLAVLGLHCQAQASLVVESGPGSCSTQAELPHVSPLTRDQNPPPLPCKADP